MGLYCVAYRGGGEGPRKSVYEIQKGGTQMEEKVFVSVSCHCTLGTGKTENTNCLGPGRSPSILFFFLDGSSLIQMLRRIV